MSFDFEELIAEVQARPELWQSCNPASKNKRLVKQTWRDIATKLGHDEEFIKKRWKHLKDQYRKELKKKPMYISVDEEWVSSWQYYDLMTFLKDELLPVGVPGNWSDSRDYDAESNDIKIEENFNIEDIKHIDIEVHSTGSQISSASSSRKRKGKSDTNDILELKRKKIRLMEKRLSENSKKEMLHNDEDYLFLMSVLPIMKKLSQLQKLRLRGKINKWLLEALTQNEKTYLYEQERDSAYFHKPGPSGTTDEDKTII